MPMVVPGSPGEGRERCTRREAPGAQASHSGHSPALGCQEDLSFFLLRTLFLQSPCPRACPAVTAYKRPDQAPSVQRWDNSLGEAGDRPLA